MQMALILFLLLGAQVINSHSHKNTLIASCMKRTAMSMPKSSPAILVNLLIMVQALNIARRTSISAVQTQTLQQKDQK